MVILRNEEVTMMIYNIEKAMKYMDEDQREPLYEIIDDLMHRLTLSSPDEEE